MPIASHVGLGTLGMEAAQRVEAICERLQASWKNEERPRVAEYLAQGSAAERAVLLHRLVSLDMRHRRRAGEHPRPEDYQAEFPDLNPAWLDDGATSVSGKPDTSINVRDEGAARARKVRCPQCQNPLALAGNSAADILCPACGSNFRVGDATPTDTTSAMRPLGKFQLLERVGLGAFGAVWRARDTELDRVVALKIPHGGLLASPGDLERFHREARAAAQLRHPGIVPVHEVVILEGLPTLVADFIHGVPLKDLLETRPLACRASAALIAELADALDYAHSRGLVHRDIKPANIMIENPGGSARGQQLPRELTALGRPLIMDFGLALRDDAEATITVDGQILGTPAYMSPEQAMGAGHRVDRRSDVYSLGVVFYQLLTGDLPFRGSKQMILRQVLHEEPRAPRRLNDKVPRDLQTICLKAMHKQPNGRYATARDLADDLRRYLDGRPIVARPAGLVERTWKWARRRPAAALAALACAAAALVLVAATALLAAANRDLAAAKEAAQVKERETAQANVQLGAAKDEAHAREKETAAANRELAAAVARADAEAQAAKSNLKTARERAYVADMRLAQSAWESNNLELLHELLEAHVPRAGQDDFRGFEWYYWRRLSRISLLDLPFPAMNTLAYSPDGQRLVIAGWHVCVLDARSGKSLFTITDHRADVVALAYSPDGTMLATTSRDDTTRVWDAASGKQLLVVPGGHFVGVGSLAFSPDSKRLAVTTSDKGSPIKKGLVLLDVADGREVFTILTSDRRVAFSPVGDVFATAGNFNEVSIWDAASGRLVRMLSGHESLRPGFPGGVTAIAFRPDGKQLASAGADCTVRVWDMASGKPLHVLKGHATMVTALSFSPDGKKLVGGEMDGVLKVWDAEAGTELFSLKGHRDIVRGVACNSRLPHLASCSRDGTVKIWDARLGPAPPTLRVFKNSGAAPMLAYNKDGTRLAVTSEFNYDKRVNIWDVAAKQEVASLPGHAQPCRAVAFGPNGKFIATGSRDKSIKLWDALSGQETALLEGHTGEVNCLSFSSDGKRLASGGGDGSYIVVPGKPRLPGHGVEAIVWDVATGKPILTLKGHAKRINDIAFAPDDNRLATAGADGFVKIWDAVSGKELQTLRGHQYVVNSTLFSKDGKRLASAGQDGTVRVWDLDKGNQVLLLKGHKGEVKCVAYTRDGRRLVSGEASGMLRFWNAVTGELVMAVKAEGNVGMRSIVFRPDGACLACGMTDGTIRFWEAPMP